MVDQSSPTPPAEPSVWDYLADQIKSWINPRPLDKQVIVDEDAALKQTFPWLIVAAVVLALIAQLSLEPSPGRTAWSGVILYGGALACTVLAVFRAEWKLPCHKPPVEELYKITIKIEFLLVSLTLGLLAFLAFGSGRFTPLNMLLWILSILFFFLAFWPIKAGVGSRLKKAWQQIDKREWQVRLSRGSIIVLAVIAVILFFNFYRLDSVPPEMLSDQAEKLLDINDILNGYRPVYFPRNTGREVLHFYASAAFMSLFNLDVSFLNLKIVAVFANLLTLFFIYLLGKEWGDRWVGLVAALFAGMAYGAVVHPTGAAHPILPPVCGTGTVLHGSGSTPSAPARSLMGRVFLGLGLHGYTLPHRADPGRDWYFDLSGAYQEQESALACCAGVGCDNSRIPAGVHPIVALLAAQPGTVHLPCFFSPDRYGGRFSKFAPGDLYAKLLARQCDVLLEQWCNLGAFYSGETSA